MGSHNQRPGEDHPLDDPWTEPALAATARGEAFAVHSRICNEHRAVGARLSGELSIRRAKGELDEADVTFDLDGTAGQSFGAFAARGSRAQILSCALSAALPSAAMSTFCSAMLPYMVRYRGVCSRQVARASALLCATPG
jgi:hypothetical protein